jgi:glyoxylase-like metal-dependent hydrolase (beta-lactamase superfamily II)/ferredoxin
MAKLARRLPENAAGDFYVDDTCIDCDTCRMVAPAIFARSQTSERSFVTRQPEGVEERRRALMALVACPTASIGTLTRLPADGAADDFPEPITPDVFYCGYTAESSFGASSYLIRREAGNALVDSPRGSRRLFARIAELGGVSLMFLTHRDDVADHRKVHAHFGCERILHQDDVTSGTSDVELKLTGQEPIALASDLLAIPVPGHTRGSMALLYRDTYLFTGDHLWWSPNSRRLHASRDVCWHSWSEQVRSLERLLEHRFTWVLPGHGRRFQASSPEAMRHEIEALLERLAHRAA